MSIFAQAKAATSQAFSIPEDMDLALVAERIAPGTQRPDAITTRLQRLQRLLRLDFDTSTRDLGLPVAMAALIPSDAAPLATIVSLICNSKMLDLDFYLEQRPEGDLPIVDPVTHYATVGWQKGLSPNFYFDPEFYAAQMPPRETRGLNPIWHYLYVGEANGLRPSRYFDPLWYRRHYNLAGQSALCHYLRHLADRTFSPNPDFDVEYYMRTYPDVRDDGGDPLRHYLLCGEREGRHRRDPGKAAEIVTSNEAVFAPAVRSGRRLKEDVRTVLASQLFDAAWYRERAAQTASDPTSLIRHYLTNTSTPRVNPNPLFDVDFYLQRHGESLAGADPFVHYVRDGWRRNFDPHPLFSVRFYLEENSDVREAGREPLAHYLESGFREGRSPCEDFDTNYYLRENPDVATQGCEPLRHYLEYGGPEGRNPSATFETGWYAHNVLKGKSTNPLVHFRLSGYSTDDVFARNISLSRNYEMSDRDFRRWSGILARQVESPTFVADVVFVRVGGSCATMPALTLDAAVAESRKVSENAAAQTSRVYLFCAEADEIDERFLPRLAEDMARYGDLGTFDFAFRRGALWAPMLLPGANAAHLESVDASFSRFAISARLLARIDVRPRASAYDILRAALSRLRAEDGLDRFSHSAVPLLHTADLSETMQTARMQLAQRAHIGSRPKPNRRAPSSVSVVICSKDRSRLLSQLLDGLLEMPMSLVREIVVVANPAVDSYADRIHRHYATKSRVTVLRHEGPYNFSQQSNHGAARCSGDLLLFLNDDIVPVVPHWLEALRSPFGNPKVGITGPLLLYPDERIQHAGMYVGYNEIAGHVMRGARVPDEDYMFMASAARNVTTVTGAALLTSRALFEDLNGFDRQLGTYLQDVDYCLRARNSDHEIVYEPTSLLFHMESVSMRETHGGAVFGDRRPLEHRHFVRKWGSSLGADAFHNPNFVVSDECLRTIGRPST